MAVVQHGVLDSLCPHHGRDVKLSSLRSTCDIPRHQIETIRISSPLIQAGGSQAVCCLSFIVPLVQVRLFLLGQVTYSTPESILACDSTPDLDMCAVLFRTLVNTSTARSDVEQVHKLSSPSRAVIVGTRFISMQRS